jgi:hypothetical protein
MESILTVHNLLFTILSLSLLLPKVVLAYEGESAAPRMIDWFYGVVIALV